MARIRTIKPEFWSNDKFSELPIEIHAFAAGLLNYCDDEGWFNANPKLIGVTIFPVRDEYRNCTVHLQELSKLGFIKLYNGTDGRVYGHVVNFVEHQVINKPKPSKIKDLIDIPYEYGTNTVSVPVGKERKGTGKGKEQGKDSLSVSCETGHENKYPDNFEDLWKVYPKNGCSKKVAYDSFLKAIKKAPFSVIIEKANRYKNWLPVQSQKDLQPCHLSTWLNQERWENDYEISKVSTNIASERMQAIQQASSNFLNSDRNYDDEGRFQ